jgi:hypothetical protein
MARKPTVSTVDLDVIDDGLVPHDLDETPLFATLPVPPVAPVSPIDLSGKPKLVCVAGLGQVGKSMVCRILAERSLEREGAALVSVDPSNRELARFFTGVLQPKSRDRDSIDAYLDRFVEGLRQSPGNAIIDFGGGDTALAGLVRRLPDLEQRLADAGISTVMLYPLSGRQADLTPLNDLSRMGFRPKATALILNHIHWKRTESHQQAFRLTTAHPVYKAAIDAGAVPIWLPFLSSAALVRDREILFADAIAGRMPPDKQGLPLGMAQSADVEAWWRETVNAFAPIDRWLP